MQEQVRTLSCRMLFGCWWPESFRGTGSPGPHSFSYKRVRTSRPTEPIRPVSGCMGTGEWQAKQASLHRVLCGASLVPRNHCATTPSATTVTATTVSPPTVNPQHPDQRTHHPSWGWGSRATVGPAATPHQLCPYSPSFFRRIFPREKSLAAAFPGFFALVGAVQQRVSGKAWKTEDVRFCDWTAGSRAHVPPPA